MLRLVRLPLTIVLGLGFPLTQVAIDRLGRRGAVAVEGVVVGLAVLDVVTVASGEPRRLARLPALLLWLELGASLIAAILGLAAIVRPHQPPDMTAPGLLETLRRGAIGTLFGVRSYRSGISLRPDGGRRRA